MVFLVLVGFWLLWLAPLAVQAETFNNTEARKILNVRVAPLALLVGFLTADMDFGLGESATLGPSLSLFNRNSNNATYTGASLGARANFSLGHRRFTDSWVIGPYLDLIGLKVAVPGYGTVPLSGTLIGTVVSYQWFWANGFNIELGGSVGFYTLNNNTNLSDGNGNTITVSTPYSGSTLGIDFTLGWAF